MSDKQFLDYDGLKRLVMNIRTAIHNAGHIVYMGTVKNVDALPDISTQAVGWMYTISEEGYTTADFTDGEGQYISAYSEVAILNVNGHNKWSILGPIFDMPAIQKAISDEAAARTAADNELQTQITSNRAAIETETTNRANADNELQSQITSNKTAIETETTDRENADNELQSQITSNKTAIETEAVAREAGDTANKTAIENEVTNRENADNELQTQITSNKTAIETETTNRANADNELQSQITSNKTAIETLNGTGNGSVSKTVADKIAEVVAGAPESLDTLKEISDWIDTHEDSASAMNTQIQANKKDIASLVTGKSDVGHKHSADDITSGTLPIARGGTGQTTQADINKAFVGGLSEGTSDVTDGTMFVSSVATDNGFAETNEVNIPYKRKFSHVWEYIKGKISSVLGLTASNYGGKASTAGTADSANALTHRGDIENTDTFQSVMNNDGKWVITDLDSGWHGSLYALNAGGSQSGLMFRIVGGSTGANQVQMNYSVDSNKFGMDWATLINSKNIGSQTVARAIQDGNGNNITNTYVKKSGDTITGNLTVNGSFSARYISADDSRQLYYSNAYTLEKDHIIHIKDIAKGVIYTDLHTLDNIEITNSSPQNILTIISYNTTHKSYTFIWNTHVSIPYNWGNDDDITIICIGLM